ncbi:MAG: YaeQ family protein [Desulfuromonadales bacterium]|nr:YaeQ family protein [Desulfuromonadales bacterium]
MALPPIIYRVAIDLADSDRDRYVALRATVARHPSETAERLIVRLLAYAWCYEEGLVFTKGISSGDEPDLWVKGADGRTQCWIEVGLPEAERLLKAGHHVERVVLFAYGSGLRRWKERHLPKLSRAENIVCYGVDDPFIAELVPRLERSLTWALTVAGGVIYLEMNGEAFATVLTLLSAGGA